MKIFIPFLIVVACYILVIYKDATTPPKTWYPKSGFIIISKRVGKNYGKYEYIVQDAWPGAFLSSKDLLIRADNNWNVGDTILLSPKIAIK